MGSQGTTKGTKMKMHGRWKNPGDCLGDFKRSRQDFTFSIRIQDGIPRDNQRDENWKCLTGGKPLSSFFLEFMSSQQDLNFPTRIQDGRPSSTLNSKESFGIAKITEGFIVYRSLILGHFWWDLYRRRDVSFQPQSVGSRKELCMFRRRPGRNISFRTITPSNK